MRGYLFFLLLAVPACAGMPVHVTDAAGAIALAKQACRDFPNAATLTAWTASLHGAVWEVEGLPDIGADGAPRANAGQGASVTVPVDGQKPTRCGGFFYAPSSRAATAP